MRRRVGLLMLWLIAGMPAGGWGAPPTVSFSGKVIDARGRPAGGAVVSVSLSELVLPSDPTNLHPTIGQTRAAADGSFHLDVPVHGERWWGHVAAAKAGSAPGGLEVRPETNAAGLLLSLTTPSFVAGRVVDGAGRPVPDARVVVEEGYGPALREGFLTPEEARPSGKTDAQGRFRLEPVPAESQFTLRVEHPRCARWPVRYHARSGTDDTTLTISPGGSIKGRVRREDGAPLAHAPVRCFSTASVFTMAAADADGRFQFHQLPAGSYTLFAEPLPGSSDLLPEKQTVELPVGGEVECPELRLKAVAAWGVVSGRVTDAATGQPVAETPIEAERQINEPGASWYLSGPVTRSGADGSYQLRLPPGNWIVYPFPPSPAWILAEPLGPPRELPVTAGTTLTRDMAIRPAPWLHGKVLDAGGQPAAGAWVESTTAGSGWTDLDGRYSLRASHLIPRAPALTVSSRDGAQSMRLELTPEQEKAALVVRLRQIAPVTGRVVDEEGRPIPHAQVTASQVERVERQRGASVSESSQSVASAVTDAEGRFSLPLFPNATFSLDAMANHRVPQQVFPVEVGPGKPAPPLQFELAPADGFVAGIVTDLDGKPIRGVTVLGSPTDEGLRSSMQRFATTDASGHFRLEELPHGPIELAVGRSGRFTGGEIVPAGTSDAHLTFSPKEPAPEASGAPGVGSRAPEIRGARWVTGDGPSGLSALRGKRVVLQFSSAYNPAAESSNATLKALYAAAKERNRADLIILAVYDASLPAADVLAYARAERLPFPVGLVEPAPRLGTDSPLFKAWGVRQLPTLFVLDGEGIIRAVNPPREALMRLVEAAK